MIADREPQGQECLVIRPGTTIYADPSWSNAIGRAPRSALGGPDARAVREQRVPALHNGYAWSEMAVTSSRPSRAHSFNV